MSLAAANSGFGFGRALRIDFRAGLGTARVTFGAVFCRLATLDVRDAAFALLRFLDFFAGLPFRAFGRAFGFSALDDIFRPAASLKSRATFLASVTARLAARLASLNALRARL